MPNSFEASFILGSVGFIMLFICALVGSEYEGEKKRTWNIGKVVATIFMIPIITKLFMIALIG